MIQHKVQTALSLSAQDWRRFLRAWGLLLLVDLGLRTISFRSVQWKRPLGRARNAENASAETGKIIKRTQDMVELAARYHIYPMTCLRRSLVLQRMLAVQGIQTDLRFGAQYDHGALTAHAWLEYGGQPVGEPEQVTERYQTLMTLADNISSLNQPENSTEISG